VEEPGDDSNARGLPSHLVREGEAEHDAAIERPVEHQRAQPERVVGEDRVRLRVIPMWVGPAG
tara:strand:- start:125 stop:313 length:189 start_codon:yes stop_codon:yes gene_type:complete